MSETLYAAIRARHAPRSGRHVERRPDRLDTGLGAYLSARPASILGGVVVAIIVGLAALRELIAPEVNLLGGILDLFTMRFTEPNPLRPVGLLFTLVGALWLLGALTRVLDRRGWSLAWQAVVQCGLCIALGAAFAIALKQENHYSVGLRRALIAGPIGGMQVFALWVLAFRYPQVVDDARKRAVEAERLRRAAELSRLREHLQPHFLRNTLNAIAASVRDDPDEARELIAALGDLLSDSLDGDRQGPTQTLGEETDWLRRYSEIFAIRHRGALRFSWDLDPAASSIELPRLLLQPLVENAIRHGALARAGSGEVRIASRRTGDGVTVIVEDNGPGLPAGRTEAMTDARTQAGTEARTEGLGLHLVRRRLAIECRGAFLRLESSASGTRAIVELA